MRRPPPPDPIAAVTLGPFDAAAAGAALARILDESGADAAVTIVPVPALLTTAQAADVLGVGRAYVARLVDDGTLPSRFHGLHRRIRRADVLACAARRAEARSRALDAVADLSRRDGLYDDDF